MTKSILIRIIRITSTSLIYDNVDCNTYHNNYCNIFDFFFFIYFTAVISSLGMMTGKVMACSYIGGLRDTALSTRIGKKLYFFLHLKDTPQVIFTTVMKQHCSTNLFPIEFIVMLMTSLLVLQNIKTGWHCWLLQTWMDLTTESCMS